jgi:hypothetical protein
MTTRTSRAALAFLLAGALATTALPAAPLFQGGASPEGITTLEPLNLLERLMGVVTRWHVKNGCSVDPDGKCVPKRRPMVRKNGCSVDPSGRCLPVKNGCSADPDGRCIP